MSWTQLLSENREVEIRQRPQNSRTVYLLSLPRNVAKIKSNGPVLLCLSSPLLQGYITSYLLLLFLGKSFFKPVPPWSENLAPTFDYHPMSFSRNDTNSDLWKLVYSGIWLYFKAIMGQHEYLTLSSIPGMMIETGLNIFFSPTLERDILSWHFKGTRKEIENTKETTGQEVQLITWKQYYLIKMVF